MASRLEKSLSTCALFGTVFTFVVMCIGAFTRLMDAGLGCPDWPGCYGHLTVPNENLSLHIQYPHTPLIAYKAWTEMIHRYFAGTLSTLMLAIIGLSVMLGRKNRRFYGVAIWLTILILYQIALGSKDSFYLSSIVL